MTKRLAQSDRRCKTGQRDERFDDSRASPANKLECTGTILALSAVLPDLGMSDPRLKYRTGEEIKRWDRVFYHGNPATIELVACDPQEPEQAWYVGKYGGGIMILDPLLSGRTFIPADQLNECEYCEDLKFISRGSTS